MKSWLLVFFYRHEVQERKPTYLLLYHYTAQATDGNFLLAARNINHQYIVERSIYEGKTKKLSSILLCLVFCFSFSTAVYAASYIYYDGGLKSATVDVENRLSNSSVYKNSVSAWNSTNTPVNIKTVPGSGHSYVIDGVYNDTWYGLYTPKNRQWIISGRAGKFTIELNRKELVSESDNFWQSVLVHELGHAFCLDDNPSSGNSSIMNYDRNRNTLIKPTSNDIAGVNSAY